MGSHTSLGAVYLPSLVMYATLVDFMATEMCLTLQGVGC